QAFIDPESLGVFAFRTTTVPLCLVLERTVAGAGGNDKQISNVFAHAWHRIESYQTLHVDGEEVTFSGDDAQGDWAGILTWQRADGTQSTALTVPGWDTNAVFAGVAHSSMTWNYLADSEKLR